MTIGVYEIVCLATNKRYVGSTRNSCVHRFWCHMWSLRNKKCRSVMQDDFDRYGAKQFVLKVFPCDAGMLKFLEQKKISYWKKRDLCYNRNSSVRADRQYKRSVESRKNMRAHARKISEEDMKFIREEKFSRIEMARKFGLSLSTISSIRLGYTWKEL